MKITDIKCYPVFMGRNQLLVKIETDSGDFGWGESGLSNREHAVAGMIEHLKQVVVGKDPFDIGRLWQLMYRNSYFEGGRTTSAAISAIDIALHDLKAKTLGVPVHSLLGGKHRDWIDTFATMIDHKEQSHLEQAQILKDAGWRAFRAIYFDFPSDDPTMFEPREMINRMVKSCTDIRSLLGNDALFGLELHHRFSTTEVVSFAQRLPRGTLDFIEEPIRCENPDAYAELRTMIDIPFAVGEEFSSKWQALPYLERSLIQFNRVDICNIGGFTEAMKVASLSEAHYCDLMPHNPLGPICTAASVHLGAAVPNFVFLEEWEVPTAGGKKKSNDAIVTKRLQLDGTHYAVPTGPGLGIEIDEAELAAASNEFQIQTIATLQRRDGSKTNH